MTSEEYNKIKELEQVISSFIDLQNNWYDERCELETHIMRLSARVRELESKMRSEK